MSFVCEEPLQCPANTFFFTWVCSLSFTTWLHLAPSASDHMHNIANWIVVSTDLSWNPQMNQDGGGNIGLVFRVGDLLNGKLNPVCVKPDFEFGSGMRTANKHSWGGRVQGLCDGPCLQGQRELCGELCCLQTQKLVCLRAVILSILPAREMGPRELPLP